MSGRSTRLYLLNHSAVKCMLKVGLKGKQKCNKSGNMDNWETDQDGGVKANTVTEQITAGLRRLSRMGWPCHKLNRFPRQVGLWTPKNSHYGRRLKRTGETAAYIIFVREQVKRNVGQCTLMYRLKGQARRNWQYIVSEGNKRCLPLELLFAVSLEMKYFKRLFTQFIESCSWIMW